MTKSFIPWYGGKFAMCEDIISYIPLKKFNTFVEVFGGGSRVLINKPPSELEIYNDLDEDLVALFRCIKNMNKAKLLRNLLRETSYCEATFDYAIENYNASNLEEVERARLKFILITQSFNSSCRNWRKPTTPNIIETYYNRIVNMLDFVPRFKDVIIENMDFEKLIDIYDSDKTFFYLDPPYIGDTRGAKKVYKHDADDKLHIRMVDRLLNIKGMAIVSGYDHKLYDRISIDNWQKIKLGEYAKSSQKTSKGGVKTMGSEYIWKNY